MDPSGWVSIPDVFCRTRFRGEGRPGSPNRSGWGHALDSGVAVESMDCLSESLLGNNRSRRPKRQTPRRVSLTKDTISLASSDGSSFSISVMASETGSRKKIRKILRIRSRALESKPFLRSPITLVPTMVSIPEAIPKGKTSLPTPPSPWTMASLPIRANWWTTTFPEMKAWSSTSACPPSREPLTSVM